MGLVFVPISAMAYTSLESRLVSEATGVFGLVRSVGGSIGIAVISAFTARHAQLAWGQLRGGVQESSTVLRDWLDAAGLDLCDDCGG
jgi:DHA2 family multidrug resistance protein